MEETAEEKTTAALLKAFDLYDEGLERALLKYWIGKCRNDAKRHTNTRLQQIREEVEARYEESLNSYKEAFVGSPDEAYSFIEVRSFEKALEIIDNAMEGNDE